MYNQNRDQIPTGSLIFFKAQSFKHKIVTFITGGLYSHCGIAFWVTDSANKRLLLAETFVGGCRIVNLSAYSDRDMLMVDVGLDWGQVGSYVMDKTGKIDYGYFDFIIVGVKDTLTRLGLKSLAKRLPNTPGELCSEMVADVLKSAGFHMPDVAISPEELLTFILTNKWNKTTLVLANSGL